MLHDHRAFDRADPDIARALDDALEPVAELLVERAKPRPRHGDEIAAWEAHLGELRSRVRLIAERAGIAVEDLERAAEGLLRRKAAKRGSPSPATIAARARPAASFKELAVEDARITAELAELRARIVAIDREIAVKAKAQAALHKRMFARGRRLGHG